MQLPGPAADWIPIASSSQFIDSGSSTALTIPAVPTSGGRSVSGAKIVAILFAQTQAQWIRTDGSAVTAAVTGGIKLAAGDYMIVYGSEALGGIRVIRDASGGSLAVAYYFYRPAPGQAA